MENREYEKTPIDAFSDFHSSKSEYIQRLKKHIETATTTQELYDVISLIRMNDVLTGYSKDNIIAEHAEGILLYVNFKIKKLQQEDKRNGLSLVQ